MPRSLHFLPALLLLASLNFGCTAMMWGEALQTRSTNPRVRATIDDGQQQRIMVDYVGVRYRTVLLPVDADGRLADPLVYRGDERAPDAIAADVTDQQLAAIRQFRFRRESFTGYLRYFNETPQSVSIYIPQIDCTAVALDSRGRPLPLVTRPNGQRELADDALVILIPNEQPVPPGKHAREIAAATVLTPLTLAADVVLVPVVVPAGIILGLSGAFTD